MPLLLIVLLVSSALMWAGGVILEIIFKQRLKQAAPHLVAELTPGLLKKSIAGDLKATAFILKREYHSISNPKFVKFCEFYRVFTLSWFVLFGITITSMLISFASS